jgi:nuclear transport factor 2 (NTF2) superfamily protein
MTELEVLAPVFTEASARQKIRHLEECWNTRDTKQISKCYTSNSTWRDRHEKIDGIQDIVFLINNKWKNELNYRCNLQYWAHTNDRIAIRFEAEYKTTSGQWFRAYGNENWAFDENGLIIKRYASVNKKLIQEKDLNLI